MFEDSLIASRRQARNKMQALTLPIALIIHVVAISGFVIAQVWVVPELSEPPQSRHAPGPA